GDGADPALRPVLRERPGREPAGTDSVAGPLRPRGERGRPARLSTSRGTPAHHTGTMRIPLYRGPASRKCAHDPRRTLHDGRQPAARPGREGEVVPADAGRLPDEGRGRERRLPRQGEAP